MTTLFYLDNKSFGIVSEDTKIPFASEITIEDTTPSYTTFIYKGVKYDINYTESQLDTYEASRATVIRYIIEHWNEKEEAEKCEK